MKRIISFVLVLIMTISLVPSTSAASFSDLSGHWAESVMLQANKNGLLYGENGKMNPNGLLTRAQIAAIITRAFGATYQADMSSYTDVPANAWFYKDIAKAVGMGIMVNRGMIMPNQPVTRLETFLYLATVLKLDNGNVSALNKFSDAASVSEYAKSQLAAMVEKGYVKGNNGKINPNDTITRAEFASLFANIMPNFYVQGVTPSATMGNIIVNKDNSSLSYCTVNGDLIIADGANTVSLTGVSIYGDLIIRGGATSVVFDSTTIFGKVIVCNPHATVNLTNYSSLAISEVNVTTPTQFTGNYSTVTATADVTITSGIVQKLEANQEAINILVNQNSRANNIFANAKDIVINGSGLTNVILKEGVTSIMLNGMPIYNSVITSTAGYY